MRELTTGCEVTREGVWHARRALRFLRPLLQAEVVRGGIIRREITRIMGTPRATGWVQYGGTEGALEERLVPDLERHHGKKQQHHRQQNVRDTARETRPVRRRTFSFASDSKTGLSTQ